MEGHNTSALPTSVPPASGAVMEAQRKRNQKTTEGLITARGGLHDFQIWEEIRHTDKLSK